MWAVQDPNGSHCRHSKRDQLGKHGRPLIKWTTEPKTTLRTLIGSPLAALVHRSKNFDLQSFAERNNFLPTKRAFLISDPEKCLASRIIVWAQLQIEL